MDKKVKIYSTPTCPHCQRAKAYLGEKSVAYEDINVADNPEAGAEMVKVSGQMSVPVIVIDDNIVIGFDKAKLEKLLA